MRLCPFLLLLAVLAVQGPHADNSFALGYREDTVIVDDTDDDCVGAQIYNHDYSFENGYCWQTYGIAPPYYGAWGEAFDVGPATVECGLYWLTQIGYMPPAIMDMYIWRGGVSGPPSEVLRVVPDSDLGGMGWWPTCTMLDGEIGCCVTGDFTVGFWADFYMEICQWYVCADESGPSGHPWTNLPPGSAIPAAGNIPTSCIPTA